MSSRITIVMYHYVRPIAESRFPQIRGLELDLFRQQLLFLKENYTLVSCDDLRSAVAGKKELPERAMLLTFDDGYIDHYTYVFPLLLKHGIRGFFSMPGKILAERKLLDVNKIHFILASADAASIIGDLRPRLEHYRGGEFDYPDFETLYAQYAAANRFDPAEVIFIKRILQTVLPERLRNILTDELFRKYIPMSESAFVEELYMTCDQISAMTSLGMEFGIHGYDHNWLGNLSAEAMRNDLNKAVDFFRDILPKNGWGMCFPYGSFNDDTVEYAKSKGAGFGFSTKVKVADIECDGALTLPRLDTNDFPPKSNNYQTIP